ncbi:hypothetical protein AGABI1DRAFT_115573 [Agaricus bisporus var. burnettii JB137-S8]|uniref:amidase n=1 Tax=Agaricus bisporus var. burnettii (strain JB137-S8 / ATCC MYA-4627 / FGSC 10392) TaxID=597362 RepID=K5WNM4_AGABU|nr:uncharacterized protein AGABI1DRAFT_115573 [Agaricus bisporus var. burnettii JB137-S8]EKM76941.1 hypothetical protein AGABI1DRAFT_115573 [Agaricus bisporus var. burnettii JB137-S8]
MFSCLRHRNACRMKQEERNAAIDNWGYPDMNKPVSPGDLNILNKPVSQIVEEVKSNQLAPADVLAIYMRKALRAQVETNCLTEILVDFANAKAKECNKEGPLAGMPVSLKDTVGVQGYDSCIGYSAWTGKPFTKDSAIVRLLVDAGAVPFVKTNVPITLLSFESFNDVWGRTTNPHKKTHSAGGSTGGEAALLAYGGSRIGIGTDVAGSVRVPGHYSGIYTVKASVGRIPRSGCSTSMPGQEGVPAVYSPMARTLEDLEYFWKAVVSMKPWKYDHSCLPLPWRPFDVPSNRPLRWGIMKYDGCVRLSPACERALDQVIDVLRKHGHEVIDISPPNPYEGIRLASQLLLAEGGQIPTDPLRSGESNDPGIIQALRTANLPNIIRKIYALYVRYIRRDEVYAGLIDGFSAKSTKETWGLIAQREAYKGKWFEFWNEEELDYVLTAPNALPAVPHGGMKKGWKVCGYSFLFNLLDYSAGVLPITKVDATLDALPHGFKSTNAIEAGAYAMYKPKDMDGLPLGVQVVGRRLEEEKVMEGMKIIQDLMQKEGEPYELIPF